MFPFPSPNETMNRELEGLEQREIEEEATDAQDTSNDLPETKQGAETESASDETLQDQK